MRLKCVAGGEVEKRLEGGCRVTSELAGVQRKPNQKDERISFFSPNIKLTFFPLFYKNA